MSGLIAGATSAPKLRVKEFRTSGTWTNPGAKTVELFMVGGGGGSFSSNSGLPGQILEIKYDVEGKASCAVAIGAGGVNSASGGNTTFDGVAIAYGGQGAVVTASSRSVVVGKDGFGGMYCPESSTYASAPPINGAVINGDGKPNTGAGAAGTLSWTGGSGYLRVEWTE